MRKSIHKIASCILLWLILVSLSACSFFDVFSLFKENPYKKLKDYLINNTNNLDNGYGDIQYFGNYTCMILYEQDKDYFSFTLTFDTGIVALRNLTEDNNMPEFLGRYQSDSNSYVGSGYIDRRIFSSDDKFIYDFSTSASYYLRSELKKLFETSTSLLLMYIDTMLDDYDIDVSIADLGFKKYN